MLEALGYPVAAARELVESHRGEIEHRTVESAAKRRQL
jgi:hypothetical protein